MPPQQPAARPTPVHAEAQIETHVGRAPEREEPAALVDDFDQFGDDDGFEVELEPEVQPEPRRPAHSPDGERIRKGPRAQRGEQPDPSFPEVDSAPLELDDQPEPKAKPEADPDQGKQGGSAVWNFFGVLFLLILLVVTGLVVWSLIETSNPDPRQMLQDKFGVDLGPLAPEAPADDAKAGDAKAVDAPAGDAKPGDAKTGDAKTGDAKTGDAKADG